MHKIDKQTTALEILITQKPGGLLMEQIDNKSGLGLNRRTLLRRLQELIKDGRIEIRGKGRALRYVSVIKD